MVHIFYYKSSSRMPAALFQYYLGQLPASIKKKILAFKHWQDAERTLAGNILLVKGLQQLDIPGFHLQQLKYNAFQKPCFDAHLYFNISHSGKYTICAISNTHQVGIDVEEMKELPLIDFTEFFYAEEWQQVLHSPDPIEAFYSLWTQKESFLKVIGSGLNFPLNKVVIQNNHIDWEGAVWFLQKIPLDAAHICHICTNGPLPVFTVERFDL